MSYYLKSRKNNESKNRRAVKIKNGRIMLSTNCAVCGSKKSRSSKNQEADSLLLGSNSPFGRIPLLGSIL